MFITGRGTPEFACFFVLFFSVRLLSVLRGHSVFSSPPQEPMTSDFYTRSYPLHYFLILILEKEPVFPFSMLIAKQGNSWYHFYNVFGMTRSLTGDWIRTFRTRSQHSTTRLSGRRYSFQVIWRTVLHMLLIQCICVYDLFPWGWYEGCRVMSR